MQVSAEISMYPLNEQYEEAVIAYIKMLKANQKLQVYTNSLSTQVFGEASEVFSTIQSATIAAWTTGGKAAFVVKYLTGDLSPKDGKYLLEFN